MLIFPEKKSSETSKFKGKWNLLVSKGTNIEFFVCRLSLRQQSQQYVCVFHVSNWKLAVLLGSSRLSRITPLLHWSHALESYGCNNCEYISIWSEPRDLESNQPIAVPVLLSESLKTVWVLSIMPKIPEILVGIQMERSISVSSDRNILDHLWRWSTYFGWNIPFEIRRSIFDKPVFCPN